MSRLRQTNQQSAGKQNTSQTMSGYYGGKTSEGKGKKSPNKSRKGNPGY